MCKCSLTPIAVKHKATLDDNRFLGTDIRFPALCISLESDLKAEIKARNLFDPDELHRVCQILCNPNSYLRDIANVIKKSPLLTSDILRIANSSYYNSGGVYIDRLEQAILRIGQGRLEEIVFNR